MLVDLSGPKIRTGELKNDQPVKLETGAQFIITTEPIQGDETRVSTNYADLPRVLKPGTRLLLDDGAIEMTVESASDTEVTCRVVNGGLLGERKGINLPGVSLPIDSLTEKDIVIRGQLTEGRLHRIVLVRRVIVNAKSLIQKR